MARIRTIKPEFWTDEKLAPLDPVTRLVFVGLISQADDAGRLVDSPRLLDGLLFPFTEESTAEPLRILTDAGVIQRGRTASGQPIIQVVNWHHQKIDKPNLSAALPPIADAVNPAPATGSEPSTKDRRHVDDTSAPVSVSVPVSVPTTADHPRETRGGQAADPAAEILHELTTYAERSQPDPVKRRGMIAKARLIANGEDRTAWEDGRGERAPPEERPRLIRLAIARVEAGESDNIRGALRYVVAQQMDPDRQRTGVQGQAIQRDGPVNVPVDVPSALDRMRAEHPDAYADALREFERYEWWKGVDNGFCADQLRQAIKDRLRGAA
jgi:hypothetical protein